MSVNKYRPHVFVLPEEDANHQLANGFLLDEGLELRSIQVLPGVGGRTRVRDEFLQTHVPAMEQYPYRHMVLLVDFDLTEDRRERVREVVPRTLAERAFVIGVRAEPEDLRKAGPGTVESVGRALAGE